MAHGQGLQLVADLLVFGSACYRLRLKGSLAGSSLGSMVCRAIRIDLSDDLADLVLSRNVTACALTPNLGGLWPYPRRSHMKHVFDWAGILPNRQMIHDMFEASEGHLVHQKSWETQVQKFLVDVGKEYEHEQVGNACY